jgi:hypothetical protein
VTEARGGGKGGRAMQVVARLHAAPPRHNAGAEWMAWSMFRALVERGHDVTVWLSRYGEDHEPYELDGVKVIPLESRLDFATAVRRASVLVSHLENVKPTAALARGYGKPFVAICHNTFTPTTMRRSPVTGSPWSTPTLTRAADCSTTWRSACRTGSSLR